MPTPTFRRRLNQTCPSSAVMKGALADLPGRQPTDLGFLKDRGAADVVSSANESADQECTLSFMAALLCASGSREPMRSVGPLLKI
jgi:hypothetical protein